MKRRISKNVFATLLVLVLVIGMLPVSGWAAPQTLIDQIELYFRSDGALPVVGDPITRKQTIMMTDDSRITLTGASVYWCLDDSDVLINNTGKDYGMYFEAGRSYNTNLVAAVKDASAYRFAENAKIILRNSGDFTYHAEITEIRDTSADGHYAHIKLTVTMNGTRTYPDITKVVFEDMQTPAALGYPPKANLYCNNCTLTDFTWLGDVWEKSQFGTNLFAEGETYQYKLTLTAKDGYRFSTNTNIVFTADGTSQTPVDYQYSDGNRVLTITYSFTIQGLTYLNHLEAHLRTWYDTVTPIAGKNAVALGASPNHAFNAEESRPYYIVANALDPWYDENGKELNYTNQFEAGKTYYFEIAYAIKQEFEHLYRFAPENLTTTIIGDSYTGRGFQKAERVETDTHDDTYVKVRYYFIAQFPDGAGQTASNPAVCNSYIEFEYAMENKDICYVVLGNVEDMLPKLPHNKEEDPYGEHIEATSIVVQGQKDLNLLGNAVFKCPMSRDYYGDCKYYTQLMTLTGVANSNLYIHGTGSLTFEGGGMYFYNSAIKVEGGSLCVDGATVRGSNGHHTGYCYGINALYGGVGIQGGATIIGEVYNGAGVCALSLSEDGRNDSLSVSIWDGKFYVDRDVEDGNHDHGIWVNKDCGLRIYSAVMDGIKLPASTQSHTYRMSDYIVSGHVMTLNGEKATPSNYHTISGKMIEIYKEISKVDIHINAPTAGKVPTIDTQDVYLVPEGAEVQSITWYENGSHWGDIDFGSARFEAGNTYQVEIVLAADEGVKFANPLASATINAQTAKLSTHGGNAQKGIVMTVDFGKCPNLISDVELTVTAPKEGNQPSYTVGCGSDAYKAVGGYNNYTYYRQWYMSSDGDEWWQVGKDHTFMSGYYYKFYVDIQTTGGYEFDLTDNGSSIVPNVSATVNGYYATVYKAYEQDPSAYITVEYNFGECNDSVVENIVVENVVEPVAGQKPVYTYSIRGSGYRMNTAKNAYYDVYWKNPPEKWYYIKNGIGWWDVTEEDWVYEHETFVAGHQYQVVLYLEVEEGYEFAHSKYYEPTVTATVNGQEAEATIGGSDCVRYQKVEYTFSACEPGPETGVDLSGTVTSFHDAAGEITLQLIPQGSGATYETAVMGNTVHYSFSGITAGSYTLKVMKKDHVTREYSITVGNSALVQDVKICLRGDVNGDGRVNVADTSKVYAQAKGNGGLTDYAFACGDVTGDGKINVADTSKIYAHAKMTSWLW